MSKRSKLLRILQADFPYVNAPAQCWNQDENMGSHIICFAVWCFFRTKDNLGMDRVAENLWLRSNAMDCLKFRNLSLPNSYMQLTPHGETDVQHFCIIYWGKARVFLFHVLFCSCMKISFEIEVLGMDRLSQWLNLHVMLTLAFFSPC